MIDHLAAIDDALAAHGFPRLSPWWARTLRSFYGAPQRRLVLRVGRRGGKSSTLCKVAVCEALFGPHDVPAGDRGVVAFVSVSKEEAKARLATIGAMLRALGVAHRPAESGDGIDLVDRPTGFRVFAATVAGVSGPTAIALIFDEVAKWRDRDTGANPASDVLSTARPMAATMPNAREFMSSSAWLTNDAHALAFDAGDDAHQLTACAESWLANPTLTEMRCRELEPDERIFDREYRCIPSDGTAESWFSGDAIDTAIAAERPNPSDRATKVAAADFGFVENSSALAIVHRIDGVYVVKDIFVLTPTPRAPLKPSEVVRAFANTMLLDDIRTVWSDGHYREAIKEHLDAWHLHLRDAPEGAPGKLEQYTEARALLHEGRVRLPDDARLRRQLLDVRARPTAGGSLSITSPRRGGAHGDVASAVVLALYAAARAIPDGPVAVPKPHTMVSDVEYPVSISRLSERHHHVNPHELLPAIHHR